MKAKYTILFLALALLILFAGCERDPDPDDPIKVPDQSFRYALFNTLLDENGELLIIDTDGNGNISYSEAEVVTYMNLGDQGISDLTGIEAFINLEHLLCFENDLNELDLSNNRELLSLYCSDNQLSSLNISNNINLWILDVPEMPSLGEVCVWEMPFPPETVLVNSGGSPNMYFTLNCSK